MMHIYPNIVQRLMGIKIENKPCELLFLEKFGQQIGIQSPHKLKIILNLLFPSYNFILIYKCSQ